MNTMNTILATKGREVHSVAPDTSVFAALKLMADRNVGALLVLEGRRLAGILSERDYARKVVLKGRSSLDTPVSDIMTTKVICARPFQTVRDVMGVMTRHAIRHLPVLDDDDQVVGVVSIGDLVKAIIQEQEFVIDQLEHYIHG